MTKKPRFERTGVKSTWAKLKTSRRVTILPDELTTQQFADAVTRVSGMPARDRVRETKSLGEIMVLAHASVFAQQGTNVFVLMDETDGRRRATQEVRWLRSQGAPGMVTVWSTRQVLHEAGRQTGWLKDDETWEQVYDQMTAFEDGLRPRSEWQSP